ncbi:ParB/RepB/Spo0J family partition protein [Actinomyces sp. oral taxon 170]|uniref:ParB/RepB/Spo0J family partition protein n=1 Tax=Actinomyces sp. oral taxon 170 TaxID=712117 RepID=UPI00031B91BE|nr:ParB/RepB/Spo0J family partition protein [Actinomyces sp. oral taxon 170]
MAQKRRGLGRGLQALIPEAQKEKVSASRPSDVFFPDSRKAEVQDEKAPSEPEHAAPEPEAEARSTRDLTATLLAPSQRKRGSKSRSTRSTSSKTTEKSKQTTSVSRETTPDSVAATDTAATAAKKTGKTSSATSAKRTRSTVQRKTTAQKRPAKKVPEAVEPAEEAVEELTAQPEVAETSSAAIAQSAQDISTEVEAVAESSPETVVTSEEPVVSRETEEGHSSVIDAEPTESLRSDEQPSADMSEKPDTRADSHDAIDGEDDAADADASDLVPVPGARFAEIPVELIHPNPRQPRQVFDEEDISELAASIAEVGLLQPIVVRQVPTASGEDPRYELIMGERRLRASKEAGLETIPAVVRDTDDVDLLRDALLENLHRVQLNPLEEAAAYQQLLEDFQCTHAELSERIARSRSQISNTLRLMKLPPLVQRRLAANVISAGHARALLGLPNAAEMERLAQRVVAEGLSVRATEELVALHEEPEPGSDQPKVLRARSTPLPALSTRLSDAFDTRVKVTRGAKKGRITIEFAGDDDLARIVGALAPGTSLDEE